MTSPDDPAAAADTAGPILALLGGFRAAKFLMAADELGVFEALDGAPADVAALAARTGLTIRAARITADALVAVGLLERDGDCYRNSAAVAAHLVESASVDLRPFVRFSDRISFPAWAGLAWALRHGPVDQITALDPERQRIFSEGVEAVNAAAATALAEAVDLTGRRLLDLGGGTGSWSIAAARRHPDLTATVFELPQVVALARRRIGAAGLTDRIAVRGGDVWRDRLPAGHDCCLLANVVHCFSAADNLRLLALVRQAMGTGGMLLLADYWTDPTHTRPAAAALMAGEYAVNIRDGDVYSLDEGSAWLARTGWRFLSDVALPGNKAVIVAQAV